MISTDEPISLPKHFRKLNFSRKNIGLFLALLLLLIVLLSSKKTAKTEPQVESLFVTAAPTQTQSPPKITLTNTINPSLSSFPTPTSVPKNDRIQAKVISVVDGDTIKIESGETVRYIGIDTPESVDPRKPVQCFAKEASKKNEELVMGKTIELENDISDRDRYGRLLRYVWIGDEMVNEKLVREGFARSYSYPPDIKYQENLIEAERQAKEENRGLWGSACFSETDISASASPKASGNYICDCSKSCAKMSSCAEAQYQFKNCGCSARDGDNDGVACNSICQ